MTSHTDDDATAARDAGEPATTDPYREQGAATEDEWFGQSAARDQELADAVVEETGGDLAEAERRFEERSDEAELQHQRHADVAPGERA